LKVIIPAAGTGRRFAEAGIASPKELLLLGGKPLIAHALDEAKRAGFASGVVVVSPAKESLVRYLSENAVPLPVETVTQPEPRGLGDAVLRCWQGEPIGVLLPDDVVLETRHWIDLIEKNRQFGAATLCVRQVPMETTNRFGIVDCDGDVVLGLVEKPAPGTNASNLAIFGRYVVTAPVIAGLRAHVTEGELELTSGFAAALGAEPGVRAVGFKGRSYDCGTPTTYASSIRDFTS
jgi:UTP--glucose-1-phosphate uridylyltransferase